MAFHAGSLRPHRRQLDTGHGNSDAQSEPQVIGLPHSVVGAAALSHDAVLEGIRNDRSWITESANISLDFSVSEGGRKAGVGERLDVKDDAPVTVSFDVTGVPNGTLRIVTDEGQTQQVTLPASGQGTHTWVTTVQLSAYVRTEVRHPMADGSASNSTSMGTTLLLGPRAAPTTMAPQMFLNLLQRAGLPGWGLHQLGGRHRPGHVRRANRSVEQARSQRQPEQSQHPSKVQVHGPHGPTSTRETWIM